LELPFEDRSLYRRATADKPKPKPDDPAQYKRFLEAAREAETDESKEGADQAFRKIAVPKRKPKSRD
jgi:hypothetical protein